MNDTAYVIVNFGGPRTLEEVEPFLRSLLTDKDVIETWFPQPVHDFIFGRVAKKRSKVISHDYAKIGGGSPIWADTEYIAQELRQKIKEPILTFHRYLPSTHETFMREIQALPCSRIKIFPMFPQFTYATTGTIARFFLQELPLKITRKMDWVKSYPCHPAFLQATKRGIADFIRDKGLAEEEMFFLFSAHGLPEKFVERGDLYQVECQCSYNALIQAFPKAEGLLCYQSKFGRGEWLKPYTVDVCEEIERYTKRKCMVFIPLSFTSDHIETLFEVEEQYMTILANKGLATYRAPALNRRPEWVNAIVQILQESSPCSTEMLVKR